jgi:hypothetical protein
MSHYRLLGMIVLSCILAVNFLPISVVTARTTGPNVCMLLSSGSATSSDGSMFVKGLDYKCSVTNSDGSIEWEAYNGGTYKTTFGGTLCGNSFSTGSLDDFAIGTAVYTGGACYGVYTSSSYNFNQLYGYTFPAHSGGVTTQIEGWSGNCNSYGGSSPCTAMVTV